MNVEQVIVSEVWRMLPWWQWVLGAVLALPFTLLMGHVLRRVFPYWVEDSSRTASQGFK
ncbi:hypothetical protein [Deinococcus cellulosilyticus]|uniref:Uncharacterized protein n=1 Tax=Deinococcus cellulosilyticus (strain DSM 18568 / NBRC 106333 / KACC 11606 / 5516J-15) TaxID=1223518 RepID=A0A511MVR6_DEIC1|nr:hypothetical protein [Deinococcus cellulosilyticus]GEM44664.1 hypothetical protein DC3_02990 [Deinococcus cellulosilyticus NBRC 106333 = KACC 11606]